MPPTSHPTPAATTTSTHITDHNSKSPPASHLLQQHVHALRLAPTPTNGPGAAAPRARSASRGRRQPHRVVPHPPGELSALGLAHGSFGMGLGPSGSMEGPVLFVVCIKWMDVGDGKILRCLMDGMLMDGWMDGWMGFNPIRIEAILRKRTNRSVTSQPNNLLNRSIRATSTQSIDRIQSDAPVKSECTRPSTSLVGLRERALLLAFLLLAPAAAASAANQVDLFLSSNSGGQNALTPIDLGPQYRQTDRRGRRQDGGSAPGGGL